MSVLYFSFATAVLFTVLNVQTPEQVLGCVVFDMVLPDCYHR